MRKEYSGIPGTTVFDGEQSRRGYHLNQFCMSLLIVANRDRFKADEEAYLSEWNLTEAQKSAVLRRDYNDMIAEGGNIYFLAKIGATDGKSFVQLTAGMTGMTPENYMAMMVRGGRAPDALLAMPRTIDRTERGK
jgi:protocatechuate 4,5-dioxygenase alpha chain